MPASFYKRIKDGKQLHPLFLQAGKLPLRLRMEICLLAWFISPLSYYLSPQKLARLIDPRRLYPSPQQQYPLDLVCYVGRILRLQSFMHQRHCISRCYLLYRFLRCFGYPAILNFGLMGDHRKEGHCWITINGQVFFDETNPDKEFATHVASSENVVYWI